MNETNWNNTFLEALFSLEDREQKRKEKILKVLKDEGFYYASYNRTFCRMVECHGIRNVISVDPYILHEQGTHAVLHIHGIVEQQERNILEHFRRQIVLIKP